MFGIQNQLFLPEITDPSQWRPVMPASGTLAAEALNTLLGGAKITHSDFINSTHSWRLSEYIRQLRTDGWPIIAAPISKPLQSGRRRAIALYELEPWALQAHKEGGKQ